MGVLWEILAFLLMLTPLVFIHELGHFIFAKLFNVKVNTFSIFMGKKLFKKKWGETEYCISMIPIGGYVSLLGEDPTQKLDPENESRALYTQPPFKRFLVIAAGPIFNVLFTILIYMAIVSIGDPVPSNKIARVVPHSKAYNAGLRDNDRIIKIDNWEIKNHKELQNVISSLIDKEVYVEFLRNSEKLSTNVLITPIEGYNHFGDPIAIGNIEGLEALPLGTRIGISDPNSFASITGLQTGDLIVGVNGNPVNLWSDLNALIVGQNKFNITIERNNQNLDFTFDLKSPVTDFLTDLGFEPAELYVYNLKKEYPAHDAGISKNDRLFAIANQRVFSFWDFKKIIQNFSNENIFPIPITIIREGKKIIYDLTPQKTIEKDPLGEQITQFYIGIEPYQSYGREITEYEKTSGVFNIISKAFSKTWELTKMMFTLFGRLFTGNASPKQLAGPLMISKIASNILSLGFIFFLQLMAMISLNLAIINLFPFPALDGGHILILTIEAISRRKLPAKAVAFVSYFGFVFLLALMLAITFNDIIRRFF